MIRVALINLLFFLLPFIGYAIFIYYRKGRIDAAEMLEGKSLYWLLGGGTVCVVIGLMVLATFQTGAPDAVYEPARYEDGVLKPGGFRDPPAAETPTE